MIIDNEIPIDKYSLPDDWENPDPELNRKCHDWKNYITSDTIKIWPALTIEQKQILAVNFQAMANREEWD